MLYISPSVYVAPLNDELALLNAETGIYFGLNPVGAHIWEFLREGVSPIDIAAKLAEEYDVEQSVLLNDVSLLIEDLRHHGLVQCDDSQVA